MGRTVVRTVGVAGAQRPMGLTERRKKATKPESGVPVGKKTPGGAGTHTGHTRDTRLTGHICHGRTCSMYGHTDHTDEPHNHPNPTTHPQDHATAESAADSTVGLEPTAPRVPVPVGRTFYR